MALAIAFRYQEREYYKELSSGEEVTFGSHKKDKIQIPNSVEHMLWIREMADEVKIVSADPLNKADRNYPCNELISLSDSMEATVYITRVTGRSRRCVDLPYQGRITVGRRMNNDIVISYPIVSGCHFQLLMEAGKVRVEDLNSTNGLYLNGKRIEKASMKSGDVLSIYTFRFVLENGVLHFENLGSSMRIVDKVQNIGRPLAPEEVGKKAVRESEAAELMAAYPQYRFSPRIREQMPKEPVILSGAPGHGPSVGGRRSNFAYLIGSGAMMAASLATGMLTPGALLMRTAGMISPVANMAMFNKMSKEEKKQVEEYERMRKERYQAYINSQKARIKKVADVQRRILLAENPMPTVWIETVQALKRNLWERMPGDSDFLCVRLGTGKVKLCVEVKSRADVDGFTMIDDELEELAGQIIEETRYVDDAPVQVSMKEQQTIGIVGSMEANFYLLRNILVELTTAHNGKDVHIVGLFNKESRKYWKELRWLPHIWDESGQVRYIAFDEKRRHTVCELLSDVIRRRRLETSNSHTEKEKTVLPHYVIFVEDENLLLSESIYDDLVANNPAYGITTVILSDSMYGLPQTCEYIIDMTDRPMAFEREKYDERIYFQPDEKVHGKDMETFARRMSAIEIKDQSAEAALPFAVTFLQGYGVNKVEELDVLERWEHSEPYRTLEAPIGMMTGRKRFSLNILDGDQAHGPHGLLAGTTGSGKSELLQTWILSMAVTYHPHDVNFVIIDYKGGGMSDLMEPLPHVVGKITNIDRNISRSLISLKSELKRRQQLFADCGVNNIKKYQQAYKNGLAKTPLPHLIIVTDEFAEMKKEEPEFMTELNSVAAIGRTLGVHMLLATQKPAGIVTDQIGANSRFRICMKVQDVADSREMLKRPDAAKITQAGRAYVRVGEDELFELFQSFYSAAEYSDKQMTDKMKLENQVRIIGVTGERINPMPKKKKREAEQDELTAVIRYINRVCKEQGIEKMAGPWLPELPRWLTLEELDLPAAFDGETWPEDRKGLVIPVGRYDIPQQQTQGVLALNLMETGHFGIYGIPGSGKTFLLKTILMSMGRCYTPKDVEVTILDAASWSMKEFENMPHVREVILNSDNTRIRQFTKRISEEIETRKKVFLKHAVSSLSAYREVVNQDMPAIVIMVDQIRPMFENYPEINELLNEIAVSGAGYGIYLIYTANTSVGLSYKFTQLVKGIIALQQPEKGDYTQLVGAVGGISIPNSPGRALMRGNPPVAFQTAVYASAQKDRERNEQVQKILEEMRKAWEKQESSDALVGREKEVKTESEYSYEMRTHIPVGIYADDLEPACMDFSENIFSLICAEEESAGETFMKRLEKTLGKKQDNKVVNLTADNCREEIENIITNLNERQESRKKRRKESGFDEQEWLGSYMQICILIRDVPELVEKLDSEEQKKLFQIITKSAGLGVILIASGTAKGLKKAEENLVISRLLKSRCVILADGNPVEFTLFQYEDASVYADVRLDTDDAALIQNGKLRFIRYL